MKQHGIFWVAMGICLLLQSCSSLQKTPQEPVTLRIYGDVNRVLEGGGKGPGTLSRFMERNRDIRVEIDSEYDEWAIYNNALSRLSGPEAASVPDIIEMPGSWIAEFAAKELLLPVTDWFAGLPEEEQSDFYPRFLKTFTYQNTLYGLPSMTGTLLLYGRKTYLGEGALPETLEEMIRQARRITAAHPEVRGFITPTIGAAVTEFYRTLLEMYEAGMPDPQNRRRVAHILAYRTLRFLIRTHQPDYKTVDYAVSEGEFRSGRVAFSINGNYVWFLMSRSEKDGFPLRPADVRVGPVPRSATALHPLPPRTWTRGYVINARTKHPVKARKLLRFLASRNAAFGRLKERYILPVRESVAFFGSDLPAMQPLPIRNLYADTTGLADDTTVPEGTPDWQETAGRMTRLIREALDTDMPAETFADAMLALETPMAEDADPPFPPHP